MTSIFLPNKISWFKMYLWCLHLHLLYLPAVLILLVVQTEGRTWPGRHLLLQFCSVFTAMQSACIAASLWQWFCYISQMVFWTFSSSCAYFCWRTLKKDYGCWAKILSALQGFADELLHFILSLLSFSLYPTAPSISLSTATLHFYIGHQWYFELKDAMLGNSCPVGYLE